MEYGVIIELRYLSKKDYSEKNLQKIITDAEEQLDQYVVAINGGDLKKGVKFVKIILVYQRWELIYCEEYLG